MQRVGDGMGYEFGLLSLPREVCMYMCDIACFLLSFFRCIKKVKRRGEQKKHDSAEAE
jgi:hypothetical protein